jgi:hypothetical protein
MSALCHRRDRPDSPGYEGQRDEAAGLVNTPGKNQHTQRRTDPHDDEDGGVRDPQREESRQPRERMAPPSVAVGMFEEAHRHQEDDERQCYVGRVLFDLRPIVNEPSADREGGDGERHGDAGEHATRQRTKQKQRCDGAAQRDEAQR